MPPKFKITGSSLLALGLLIASFTANLVMQITASLQSGIVAVQQYRDLLMPINILGFIKLGLLLWMGYLLFLLIRQAAQLIPWNMSYYKKIKGIGWTSFVILLIDAFMDAGKEWYVTKNISVTTSLTDHTLYTEVLLKALFGNPASWLLIFCVFLSADLLQFASDKTRSK